MSRIFDEINNRMTIDHNFIYLEGDSRFKYSRCNICGIYKAEQLKLYRCYTSLEEEEFNEIGAVLYSLEEEFYEIIELLNCNEIIMKSIIE